MLSRDAVAGIDFRNGEGDMTEWRTDIENAPRGKWVDQPGPKGSTRSVHQPELVIVVCGDAKTVTLSRWLPKEGRWNMLAKNETPVAWQPWPSYSPSA